MEQTAYLTLENGMVFQGKAFGFRQEAEGELVFTTAMTGYLETLTDPSYFGQLVVQTFPLIGNYGVIPSDFESSRPALRAYIVREWCQEPSNFRCEGDLDTFLKQSKVTGIYGIDTRQLTRIVREHGVMNAKITYAQPDVDKLSSELRGLRVASAVPNVTCEKPFTEQPEQKKFRVVLWDFGAKDNIRRSLLSRGCEVVTVPAGTAAEEILAYQPDGIMLSNGPGDPADNPNIVEELKKVCASKLPCFGICLGHQLMALAHGGKTGKLKYGHRGGNQPVVEKATGRVYISSQNHGYMVLPESLPPTAEVSFTNGNDGTCEGVIYHDMPAFTVQFHPEACGGPQDTEYLFDQFITLMKEAN